MTVDAPLEVRLLGRFAVLRHGVEVPTASFGGRKVRTLVRVLATRRGDFVSNDALAEVLWPDRPPADPVANLQVLVNRARKALGDAGTIWTGPGGYALVDGSCTIDAEQFVAAVSAEDATLAQLRDALALWDGEPLAEDAYADWAADYRDRLLRIRQGALEKAAALAIAEGDHAAGAELASQAVGAEPLREAAVLLLMRALAAGGDNASALTCFDDYRRALADELGVDPSPDAAALYQQLLVGGPSPTTRERRPQRRRTTTLGELSFVGRDTDLARIRAVFDAPPAPQAGVVLVAGTSGSGKSRLIDVLARDTPTVRARAYLPDRAEPWTLIRTLLRELLWQDVAYLDALPPALAGAIAWLLPDVEVASAVTVDAEARRALIQEATLRLFAADGRVVAIDDLQWCDPTSLTVLENAVARLPDQRFVFAFRPEEVGEDTDVSAVLGRMTADARIDLDGLSDSAISALVRDEDLVVALSKNTDTTPMAISEVLRALAAEGLVACGADGRWYCVEPSAAERAAELGRHGQRDAIGLRARQQPRDARDVLALMCLLAHEVPVSTLATATASSEPDVLARLSTLSRAGLVRLGELGWTTTHDMVNEAVTSALDDTTRATRHAMLAHALEVEHGDPAALARHLRGAGDVRRAATAFTRAAQGALDSFADHEAAKLAAEGLTLTTVPAEVAALREVRGQARGRLGDIAGAREDLRSALSSVTAGPDRARLLARLAMLSSGADDIVRAAELAELALVEAGQDAPTRARALEVASVLDMNLDRATRSAERATAALELYRQLGDASGTARILDARAMATFLDGDIRGGEAALRQAADLFEDAGDLVRVPTPRSTSGHALVFAGRPDDGLAQATAALDLARALGHPEAQSYSLWHRAEALASLDRPDEATADAREALDIAARLGHRGWTATAWRAVGIAAQAAGDLEGALAAFRNSLDRSEHLGLFASWAAARTALVLIALGRVDEAAPLVAVALAEGPPLGHYEARQANAELACATGRSDAAEIVADALSRADAGGMRQGRDRLAQLAGSITTSSA